MNNNFAADAHHGFINRGIDPSRIEAATHTRIPQVAVRELPRGAGRSGDFTMPDRLTRNGNSAVIYRPDRNSSLPRNPSLPGHDARLAGRGGGSPGDPVAGSAPRLPSARVNGPQRATARAAWDDSHGGELMRQWGGVGNFQAPHPAPAWHSAAPSYAQRGVPSGSAPQVSRSSPSFGGARSWGGGGNSGGGATHFNGDGANIGGGGMHFSGGGSSWGSGMGSGSGFHR